MNLEHKELRPGVSVLELVGAISMGQDCERLDQEVNDLLGRGVRQLILDLTAVPKVDSAAIGKMVACHSRVRGAGGVFRIAGAQGSVREILRMTQVDHYLSLYDTAAEAATNIEASSQSA